MFIKHKKFKNKDGTIRTYLQVCESRRVNGKPNHTVLMNLGRVDTLEGKDLVKRLSQLIVESSGLHSFLDPSKDILTEWTKNYGFNFVFKKLWKDSGLSNVIFQTTKSLGTEYDIENAVYNMTLNRLHDPSSKRGLLAWQDKIYDINPYEEHQYYRTLDHLIENKEEIEQKLFESLKVQSKESVDIALFDTTTLAYYGEGDKGEELLARGHSKIRRGDLKQVVVGVIMSSDGIPLGHEVFSGNTNDLTCFKEILEKIKVKFQIKKVILVGDRGMISKNNINRLNEYGFNYILGYRMRTIPKEDRAKVLAKEEFKKLKLNNLTLQFKDVDYEGQRLLICYNPERAKLDKDKRDDILKSLEAKLKGASIKSIVTNPDYKRFLKIKGEKPVLDKEKIAQDELYDGMFVLTTNTKLSGRMIVERYKDLWQIEAGFRCLKDELEVGPIYHWKDRRIRAHIMVCFFALVLRIILSKKLKEHDSNTSYSAIMNELDEFNVVSQKLKSNHIISRTQPRSGVKTLCAALNLKIPPAIIESNFNQNLLL